MAAPVIQERTISGKGVFALDDEYRECKRIILYATVLRPPSSEYKNVTWRPDKGFFANITICKDEFVGIPLAMNFNEQMFVIHLNDSQQVGASLVCALEDVLDSFVQYAIAELIPYVKNNSIREHKYSGFIYNRVRFVCYGGCALSLRLVGEPTDKCNPDDAKTLPPPPPPEPGQAPVPPGTPLEVDEPLADEDPEDPDTVPDPIDNPPTPPGPCVQRGLVYRVTNVQFPNGLQTSIPFEGDFEGTEVTPGNNPGTEDIGFRAGETVAGVCVPGKYYSIFQNLELPYEFEIIEILTF